MSCPSGSYTVTTVGAIAYGAFQNCDSLTSVTIGDSVTYIGNYAFNNCGNLAYVSFAGENVPSCGSSVFDETSVTSVHVIAEYKDTRLCSVDVIRVSHVFSCVWGVASKLKSACWYVSLFKFQILCVLS